MVNITLIKVLVIDSYDVLNNLYTVSIIRGRKFQYITNYYQHGNLAALIEKVTDIQLLYG